MSSIFKRERQWEVSTSGDACAAQTVNTDVKRPRIFPPASGLSSDLSFVSHGSTLTSVQGSQLHPMVLLDAIRAKLQNTSDGHLQARLLLHYSSVASSPNAKTAAAIDFFFSFLQQNQTQSETSNEGHQPNKDANSSGATIVGAIVRGLRHLLAVKAAVVQPMIQVDAMGEQLMQCISVGDDFKLRRDMMRIVVDCLMLTHKYDQVGKLLHSCVQDHDVGMQAISLRGYLRLYDVKQAFATMETTTTLNSTTNCFDRLTAFLLFGRSDEVKVLAAQVVVALAELHPEQKVARSKYFPSLTTETTTTTALGLPEKAFYVLCMAGNDMADAVRAEVARCLRRFSHVVASEVVEHAVVKTQIDEVVRNVASETIEMDTRRMMSSGVLLSLLEDVDVHVAAEASRTIARLSEIATTCDAGAGRWSQRALERTITAHFDVLSRATIPSTRQLYQVLVSSLGRLLACRHRVDTKTKFSTSSADLSCLIRSAISCAESSKAAVVDALRVFQYCDLSSVWAVQRLVDFVLEVVASPLFDHDNDQDENDIDCWDEYVLDTVQNLRKQCAKVLQVDAALFDRIQRSHRNSKHRFLGRVCQAFLGQTNLASDDNSLLTDKSKASSNGSSLFFLRRSPSRTSSSLNSSTVFTRAISSMETLRRPPADETIAVYLKAIHRLGTAFATEDLDVSFRIADLLVRLRQHVQTFPSTSTEPPLTAHKYVSMQAMLSTSPSVSSGHTSSNSRESQDPNESQAFARLHIPMAMQKGCQEMVDAASSLYVKAFALSSLSRMELLQLIFFGRIGLVLALLQNSTDSLLTIDHLRWIAREATRLRFLVNDNQRQDDIWLPILSLTEVCSLNDLKRTFVAISRKAWPVTLLEAAISRYTPPSSGSGGCIQRLAVAHASIQDPTSRVSMKSEPREVTANWPFEQRVCFLLTNVRDITQVYVKSVLPNGEVAYHHVPANGVHNRGPRKHWVDHRIRLTVSPFSDPTAFTVAVCLGHPTLPGSVKEDNGETSSRIFTEISISVRVPIFHRTSSTLRHAAMRTSITP